MDGLSVPESEPRRFMVGRSGSSLVEGLVVLEVVSACRLSGACFGVAGSGVWFGRFRRRRLYRLAWSRSEGGWGRPRR